jgi:hypothetical protein
MGCTTSSSNVRAVKILEETTKTELKVSIKSVKYRPEGKESEVISSNNTTAYHPGKAKRQYDELVIFS